MFPKRVPKSPRKYEGQPSRSIPQLALAQKDCESEPSRANDRDSGTSQNTCVLDERCMQRLDEIEDESDKTYAPDDLASHLDSIQEHEEGLELVKSDIVVAVMGVTGAGKSTFINLLTDEDVQIGHGQRSHTKKVGVYPFFLDSVRIWLIDTPGFDDTERSDSDILKEVAYWLASSYSRGIRLAGIVYLHRIIDVRMQGSALRNLRMFNELCGPNNLKSVILATTFWNHSEGKGIEESVGMARVKELETTKEFWGGMIERGSRIEKHNGTQESAFRIISDLLSRRYRVILGIQRQMVDEGLNISHTDAGKALQQLIIEERRRAEAELAEAKLDMEHALKENDKRWQEELQRHKMDLEARILQGRRNADSLAVNLRLIVRQQEEELMRLREQLQSSAMFKLREVPWRLRDEDFQSIYDPSQQVGRMASMYEREYSTNYRPPQLYANHPLHKTPTPWIYDPSPPAYPSFYRSHLPEATDLALSRAERLRRSRTGEADHQENKIAPSTR